MVFTQNTGFVSQQFVKERGMNQGCNISLFVMNICAELMARLIKNNPKITRICLNDNAKAEVTHVISQFADDTTIFLSFSEECLEETLATLTCLERNTGLKISYEKSTIYRLGSLKGSDAKYYTLKPLQWSDGEL